MADEKENNEDLELAAGEEKGSKKMLIILIAVGALVLIGGGVGAWLLLSGDDAEEGAEAETEQEAQVEQAPPIYFPLDPIDLQVDIPVKLPVEHSSRCSNVSNPFRRIVSDEVVYLMLGNTDRHNLRILQGMQESYPRYISFNLEFPLGDSFLEI